MTDKETFRFNWWDNLNNTWKAILYNSYKYENYANLLSYLENSSLIPNLSNEEIEEILKIENVFYNNDPCDGHYENEYERLNNLNNIEPLCNLKKIDFGWNNLTENNFYFNNSNLLELSVDHNNISSINFLNNFSKLELVKLDYNNISEIPDLKLKEIKQLNIGCNKITNVTNIGRLSTLEELSLYNNKIQSLSGFEALANLKTLSIFGNAIFDLHPLSKLKRLQKLVLDNNKITDLSPISNLTELVNLSVTTNNYSNSKNVISTLKDLYNLNKLEKLYIYGNPISYKEMEDLKKVLPNCNIYYQFG